MSQHTESGSAILRTVAATALACILAIASTAGEARGSVLKTCPSGSSLSHAAGTQLKLDHQAKTAGQLVCLYLTKGAALADLTVQTLSNNRLSAAAELKMLESGAKAADYKVTVLHHLGSAAFMATLKHTSAYVDVVASGHITYAGSLAVSPSHLIAIERAVVG